MTAERKPAEIRPTEAAAVLAVELVDLARRLTDLLFRENTLVRAMRIKEIGPLQGEKTRLTAQYQKTFRALCAEQGAKSIPTALRERLAISGTRLAEAVGENELALRTGKVATERLIGSIVTAVKAQKKSVTAYAPRQVPQRRAFMTAAAVDRRL